MIKKIILMPAFYYTMCGIAWVSAAVGLIGGFSVPRVLLLLWIPQAATWAKMYFDMKRAFLNSRRDA